MTRVTRKGQVTIPADIRFSLGIAEGDELVFSSSDGIGTFRRTDGALGRAGALPLEPRDDAHVLERVLVQADAAAIATIAEARASGRRIRASDATVLEVARRALDAGLEPDHVADMLCDVLAERALRVEHPRALRAAADAIARGSDPIEAYLDMRE
jgi:AbrB family looped-hinge helix DNA binding protein